MIGSAKAYVRRHWPRLRLRTILLLTFVFIAALPGLGALFLRVYENTLVRQTEAELVAQGAALAAAAAADWPGTSITSVLPLRPDDYRPEPTTIDLRESPILPERPAPVYRPSAPDPAGVVTAAKLSPILRETSRTTLAAILMIDRDGRILNGHDAGRVLAGLPELRSALAGAPATVLRRNGAYRSRYPLEWLSRASDLRIHHARPIVVNGRVVGALLLSRSPRALFRGLYEDRGKILFGIGAIFVTLVGLSGLLSRGIARPIEALGRATAEVSRGGRQVPDPPETAAIEIQALYGDFALMTAAIDRRSRYLRDFAHAMSHEFKTPLAGITGAIELLQDHHATMAEEDRRRFLANAAADAERLSLLVTRLLDLARADMSERETTKTDVAFVLRRLADAYRSETLQVEVTVQFELPKIVMPATSLEVALRNLLENSVQAGAGKIDMAATADRQWVCLELTDDGPGIPPADRARVFEPFFTSRRASGGTGIGLAITRSLIEGAGGSIKLLDDAASATFRLTLPSARYRGTPQG